MKNKTLLYVSLVSSIVGLIIVFVATENVELQSTDIISVSHDSIGKNVKICGKVDSLRVSKNKHVFFEVADGSGRINVVVFNSSTEKLGADALKENDPICLSGKVDEFTGNLEIIAQKISKE